jgi:energy-coupling factor transporter ATP-binding protein EcfA2
MADLSDIFPNVDLRVAFEQSTDEVIDASVEFPDGSIPLEISGTGLLQAIQILAYIHRFAPRLIVLDEPDSHLHPNNQRLLCALLRRVAEERSTQVVLTTHSRHVVDAVGGSSGLLWIREGKVDKARQEDEVGVLLDIGALDVKERVGQSSYYVILLTEDEILTPIDVLMSASGFDMAKTLILPYYGITIVKNLRPLVNVIKSVNSGAIIIVHRDRDFLRDQEVKEWETSVRAIGVEPFVTPMRDLESAFIDAGVLAERNSDMTLDEFNHLINETLDKRRDELVADYVNGRIDVERKRGDIGRLDYGKLAVEAAQHVERDARRFAGKAVLRGLRGEFQSKKKRNLLVFQASALLKNESLALLAGKAFGSYQKPPKSDSQK